MDIDFKKVINQQLPEVANNMHLPMLAKIDAVHESNQSQTLSTAMRPVYCADIILLDAQQNPVDGMPIYQQVPLPMQSAGFASGQFNLPTPGALCEVAFMYGLPSHIFIRHVFSDGFIVPSMAKHEHIDQHSEGVFDKTDNSGLKHRKTHGKIIDESYQHIIDTLSIKVNALIENKQLIKSEEHIDGLKLIEALGALKLLTAGVLNLGGGDGVNITTAKDIAQTVAGNKDNKAGGNISNTAEKNLEAIGKLRARLKTASGGKVYIGDDSKNIITLITDALQIIADIAAEAAAHTHPSIGAPATSVAGITSARIQLLQKNNQINNLAE